MGWRRDALVARLGAARAALPRHRAGAARDRRSGGAGALFVRRLCRLARRAPRRARQAERLVRRQLLRRRVGAAVGGPARHRLPPPPRRERNPASPADAGECPAGGLAASAARWGTLSAVGLPAGRPAEGLRRPGAG